MTDPTEVAPLEPVLLHGRREVRGSGSVSRSTLLEGRFGRMFRRLPPCPAYDNAQLTELAESMRDTASPGGWSGTVEDRDNPAIPAAYTYLGQFIDHDITFDPTSSLDRINDPDALNNFRTPRFDLDSVYGSGPQDEPFQYNNTKPGHLLVEPNINNEIDLPRNTQGVALTGDPRNDENIIVSQLHLIFLKAHNKFAEIVAGDPDIPPEHRFAETQRRLRWHYQWVVVNDYLPRIVGKDLMDRLFVRDSKTGQWDIKRRFYRPIKRAYMPVEFSAAAFRFGHSMIRGIYNLSSIVTDRPIFAPTDEVGELDDLRGGRPLPAQWTIDWSHFTTVAGSTAQPSRRIDSKLVDALFTLPSGGGSLALRNLHRGQALELPSGQDVAKALGVERVFIGAELGAPDPTPLWFYILKESELQIGGLHLGPTGGRIVAEVLLGLLEMDSQSFFSQAPDWVPTIPESDGDSDFGLGDLITFANS